MRKQSLTKKALVILPAALFWACAERPTEPQDDYGPLSANRSASVATVDGTDEDFDGFTVEGGDCDDTHPYIHPRRPEVPGNGVDDDCDPLTTDETVLGAAVTAGFDTGHSHADIITDGSVYDGLRFQTDNDWGMFYDDNKGNNSSRCLYDNAASAGDILWLAITKSDFGDFRFDSIWIGATAGDTRLTVRGFLDNVEVETTEIDVSFDGVRAFDWDRVDRIRFEADTDLFSCFDDFTYASYQSAVSRTQDESESPVDEDAPGDVNEEVDDVVDDAQDSGAEDGPTPVTADFDTGHDHGDIIVDATTYDGLRFQTDDDLGMFYDDNKGNGGSRCLYPNAVEAGDVRWFTVTKADFGNFRFDSIWIGATAGNTTVTARGFRNGTQVGAANLDVSFDGTHDLGWDRVDEVRFEARTDLFSCFDDFTYLSSDE